MGSKELCMECLQVNNGIAWMVDRFGKEYYQGEFRIEWIDRRNEDLHYNLKMNDEYWNIDEIYTALRFNIPEKTLFKWKHYQENYFLKKDKGENEEKFYNLKNFYLMEKYKTNDPVEAQNKEDLSNDIKND